MKKLTVEIVRKAFEESGCTLLTTSYTNNSTLMPYICECRRQAVIRYSDFQRGYRCNGCAMEKRKAKLRLDFDFVAKSFDENGCILLTDHYENNHALMPYICDCGNESVICWIAFKRGGRCNKCGETKRRATRRHKIEAVRKFFEIKGCSLLAIKYTGINDPMPYICECGNESVICFNAFRKGHRCAKCGGNQKYDFAFVQAYFEVCGCRLLDTHYCNARATMRYICVCGRESTTAFGQFMTGTRCKECGKEKTKEKASVTKRLNRQAWDQADIGNLPNLITERRAELGS